MPEARRVGNRGSIRNCKFTAVVFSLAFSFASCDRMITPRSTEVVREAETRAASGDYLRAIALYESALDDTPKSADIHYRLAILYDDKMSEPLNALHHFKRYLTLAPAGAHASEVKTFMKRDELALVTNFSGDAVVSRAEAVRLKTENDGLHRQIEEMRSGVVVEKKKSGRPYVVKRGDTLASISRKFYKTSARWKRIQDANSKTIDDPQNLKVGQTLTIP